MFAPTLPMATNRYALPVGLASTIVSAVETETEVITVSPYKKLVTGMPQKSLREEWIALSALAGRIDSHKAH